MATTARSDGYTPTTDEVRRCYVGELDAITDGVVGEAFDRWLESVKAEAWDEGARHVYTDGGKCSFARDGDPCPYNPYRKGEGDE